MAKDKKVVTTSFVDDLIDTMNRQATGTAAYLQGDMAQHTWGVPIPPLAVKYLLGGMNVLPMQRYFGVSGEEKSFKSTLQVEIGNWFMMDNGVSIILDCEGKLSPTMVDAMTWHRPELSGGKRIVKACRSIDEWQTMITSIVTSARGSGPRKPGERVPIYIMLDGMTSRGTEEQMSNLEKEGQSAERGYPVGAAKTTFFLESLNMLGTTVAVGWAQHMKAGIEPDMYGNIKFHEKGAKAAQFACSTHLRVSKGKTIHVAQHDGAPNKELPVQGYELYVTCALSSVGEGDHKLMVPILWQHLPQEDGTTRQAMWFDWPGALGNLLVYMKYVDKKTYAITKKQLEDVVSFTQPAANKVNCKALGLEDASPTAFGRALEANDEIRAGLEKFFHVARYPGVQEADIDFEAGAQIEKKGKK